ncbi:MAG: hypothetical protein ABH840_01045 [Nanoarchaeota archaeon]
MRNKRGDAGLPMNKLIPAILGAIVLVVVIVAIIMFGIPAILNLLPGLNQTTINTDLIVVGNIEHYSLGDVKVLLDDGNARCIVLGYVDDSKPIDSVADGYFGLWKGKLLLKEKGVWSDRIEKEGLVASDEQVWKRGIKEKLQNVVNNIYFDYNGKNIKVDLDSEDGLVSVVDGIQYGLSDIYYYFDKNLDKKEITSPILDEKQKAIYKGITTSMPEVDNVKLAFDSEAKSKVIFIPKDFGGYYYGARKSLNSQDITLVVKSMDEYKDYKSEWHILQGDYLYNNVEWQRMLTKKKIKDDLIKICSSK